ATRFHGNIYRLPPAHVATIDAQGGHAERRYWSADEIKPVRLSSNEAYAENLRACLDRAVRRQLRSATPVASYLSGGLDSSAVVALAARAPGADGQRPPPLSAGAPPGGCAPVSEAPPAPPQPRL